jgi:hypothetical protein
LRHGVGYWRLFKGGVGLYRGAGIKCGGMDTRYTGTDTECMGADTDGWGTDTEGTVSVPPPLPLQQFSFTKKIITIIRACCIKTIKTIIIIQNNKKFLTAKSKKSK